ncbi:bifunctional folylpolyglutamate synthase/dihydrofolate synthase [Blattabacterium cuenoti]|uniref:bifunctional folylpolyglutamate synthase/dihydrofolate synthase n=1 Tax=Blattabacterium cuenoti TaxID=1653831 RepID=UPI001EECDE43|nr:Mur ligase family protein [Blattabacterium cuenoti]
MKTVKWIFNRIPSYQEFGLKYFKPGLNRIKKFCNYLGDPQNFFRIIHVGGTNGKGSTVNMLYSILQEEGYNVGSFTSPHIIDFRERISCNGFYIEKNFIVDFIKKNKKFIEKESISFFEMNTAMAFQYFKEKKVYIAVVEVGMGGRLDSTNVINPEISVITNISIDHTKSLGNTKLEIANEKSGIIKKNLSVIIGNISNNLKKFFLKKALRKNSPIYFSTKKKNNNILNKYKIPFKSINYQVYNTGLVLSIINILNKRKYIIVSEKSIKKGLKNIIKNTNFKGRWHVIKKNPKIICDIAHNEEGFFMISSQLKKESYDRLHLVLGFVKEKKISSLLKWLPNESYYYFCQPNIKRKYDIKNLKIIVNKIFFNTDKKKINFYDSVKLAFFCAKENSNSNDLILVSGSTFVVSEIFLLL